MKAFRSICLIYLLFPVLLISAGCASTHEENRSTLDVEARIQNAEAVKNSLMKRLDNPKDVDEIVIIKDRLAEIQDEIDSLKALKPGEKIPPSPKKQDTADGFKDTKERRITYGPVGIVLQLTKWILETLYIIHKT